MRTIETIGTVGPDGLLVVPVPLDVAPGTHRVVVVVEQDAMRLENAEAANTSRVHTPFGLQVFATGPWPPGLSLRREDLYDDAGR